MGKFGRKIKRSAAQESQPKYTNPEWATLDGFSDQIGAALEAMAKATEDMVEAVKSTTDERSQFALVAETAATIARHAATAGEAAEGLRAAAEKLAEEAAPS